MFFYISFLRPPPLQAAASKPVVITPQIANDLRTESYQRVQDIYYSWIHISSSDLIDNALAVSKLTKLTTWRPENAYKPIQVPPPPRVRSGQHYSLILSSTPEQIYINLSALNGTIFPVISMPISFSSSDPRNVSKQEKIERLYWFSQPERDENICLKVTEQTSFDLDKKIWDSGIGLSGWLVNLFQSQLKEAPTMLQDVLMRKEDLKIIELGAGTGMVSITLGALRSSIVSAEENRDTIFVTDLRKCCSPHILLIKTLIASAQPLLEHNLQSNALHMPNVSIHPAVLDWDDITLPQNVAGTQFDLIVMADVTYNTSSFPSLLRTISLLLSQSDRAPPLILLGYKQRDTEERTLFTLMKDSHSGTNLFKIDECVGMGGEPVEIWMSGP